MNEWINETQKYTTTIDVIIDYIDGDKNRKKKIKTHLNRINFNNDIWKIINENKTEEDIYITKKYLSSKNRNIKLPNNKHKNSIENILHQFELFFNSLSQEQQENIKVLNSQMKGNLLFVNLNDNSFEHGVHYKFVQYINDLDHKFNYVIKLDIKDFFKNIYTHMLVPALINEEDFAKSKEINTKWEKNIVKPFNSQKGETNGLTLGSFFSVLWSEILMNRIIIDFKNSTNNKNIYSFGDDILIFHKSMTYDTNDFVKKYKDKIGKILEKYSPDNSTLVLNEKKVQLQYYVDWYNEQMTFYNYKKTFSKNPTVDKLLFQLNNMKYQSIDEKIKYSYVYKQFKEFNISNVTEFSIKQLLSFLTKNKIIGEEEIKLLSNNIDYIWLYESIGKYKKRVINSKEINIKYLKNLISLDPSVLMYINHEYFNSEEKTLLNYEIENLLTKYSLDSYESIVINNYLNIKDDKFSYCNEIPNEFDKSINRKVKKLEENYSKYITSLDNWEVAKAFEEEIKAYKVIKKIKIHFLKNYQLELKFSYNEKLRNMNDDFYFYSENKTIIKPLTSNPFSP